MNYQTINETNYAALEAVKPHYEQVLLNNLIAILDRYERDQDYHFIDTKLNIITGKDFYPAAPAEEFKSKAVIYSWIQGRGLEALAGHGQWLQKCSIVDAEQRDTLLQRIETMLLEVMAAMEGCRERNNGRLFFWMRPDGRIINSDSNNQLLETGTIPAASNYSDLFYAKGLFAAAQYLNLTAKALEAEAYLKQVVEDIANDNFISDQQPFDAKNRVQPVAGKKIQGPWMIALGGIALGLKYGEQKYWAKVAEQFISHILTTHINTGTGALQKYDFWEAVDATKRPWCESDGSIICDPGHALEFIGLSLKCLLQLNDSKTAAALIENCRQLYPQLLEHYFRLGFNPQSSGICKAYDLVSRQVINSDMPWWSLPETIRAGALLLKFAPDSATIAIKVMRHCSNAFMEHYINHDVYSMAWQTRNIAGEPVDIIPATPDADPGYHTGLSIIDFLLTDLK